MHKTAKFILSLLLAAAIPGLASAQDKRPSGDQALTAAQQEIIRILLENRKVGFLDQEKWTYVSRGPEYYATRQVYGLEDVGFDGCRINYIVRRERGAANVSMDASMNDPRDRYVSGVPVPGQPPSGRNESRLRMSFDLGDIDGSSLAAVKPSPDSDFQVLVFEAIGGKRVIDMSSSFGPELTFGPAVKRTSAGIWAKEEDAEALRSAFSNAITACRAAK